MQYDEFKASIHDVLRQADAGLTWVELRRRAGLPYERPCPTWTRRLEQEIGLTRRRGSGRALVWSLGAREPAARPDAAAAST